MAWWYFTVNKAKLGLPGPNHSLFPTLSSFIQTLLHLITKTYWWYTEYKTFSSPGTSPYHCLWLPELSALKGDRWGFQLSLWSGTAKALQPLRRALLSHLGTHYAGVSGKTGPAFAGRSCSSRGKELPAEGRVVFFSFQCLQGRNTASVKDLKGRRRPVTAPLDRNGVCLHNITIKLCSYFWLSGFVINTRIRR